MLRVTEMFAFVGCDANGDEGIIAASMSGMIYPLVGADMERIDSLRHIAKRAANERGTEVRLIKFGTMTVLETINPIRRG